MAEETIFALSSGAGVAGVAVVRLSGPATTTAVEQIAGALPAPRAATLRRLRDPETGEIIDHGLVLWFPKPASFTGEDMAEFQLHGGRAVIDGALAALAGMNGLRPAQAGEFTLRAFRNGRLDLVAAEGLAELLHARTAVQRRQALRALTGEVSSEVEDWRRALIAVLARIEAGVDFADEAGVAEAALAAAVPSLADLYAHLDTALEDAARSARVREGLRIVIAGPPNAGKSTLLNRLVARDAAIVSDQPGTTRDTIQADLVLGGVPAIVTDTAGLRPRSPDAIEIEGMARTHRALAGADIVLWVTAPDVPPAAPPETVDSVTLWLENKCDLLAQDSRLWRNDSVGERHYRVSALTGAGMAELVAVLEGHARDLCGAAEAPALVRVRHTQAVTQARDAIARAMAERELELVAEQLRSAAHALARVTGRIGVEDVLDAIFSEFCIGK